MTRIIIIRMESKRYIIIILCSPRVTTFNYAPGGTFVYTRIRTSTHSNNNCNNNIIIESIRLRRFIFSYVRTYIPCLFSSYYYTIIFIFLPHRLSTSLTPPIRIVITETTCGFNDNRAL